MSLKQMRIRSNPRDYQVIFENSPKFIGNLAQTPNAFFLIDNHVWEHYSRSILKPLRRVEPAIFAVNEKRKNLGAVEKIYDRLIKMPAKRNLWLVSIGGGIVQDVSGFVASTLYRGINWIYVPTTLLAQADSCIGAKTALNYKAYKNLIGTFYPPQKIHVYPGFLRTQKSADFFSGVGEMVKLHLLGGQKDTANILHNLPGIKARTGQALLQLIIRSLLIKKSYIESDEFDQGQRNLLNYGHCFGHAIESASDYAAPHGQAIVMGMILANRVALKRGWLDAELEKQLRQKILLAVLPEKLKRRSLDKSKIIRAFRQDKKRSGNQLPLIMLGRGYKMLKVNDLSEAEALIALDEWPKIIGDDK